MNTRLFALLLITSPIFLVACLDGSSSKSEKQQQDETLTQDVSISFVARAGSTDLLCGVQMDSLGNTNATGFISDFRFYVHDVSLIADNGESYALTLSENDWQTANVTLLSFKDKENCADDSGASLETNMLVEGSYQAPANTLITGVSFGVGVPFALNHEDPSAAKSPLNVLSMSWNWQGGYKHMKLEAKINNNDFIFHLGSTGCDGDPGTGGTTACARDNRPIIELANFDIDNSAIQIDFQSLIQDIDVSNIGTAMGDKCHSSAMQTFICQPAFDRLGLDFYNGAGDTLEQANPGQSVFSLILDPA